MSYSVCLACKKMVSSYQKYCGQCESTYKQNEKFWKTHDYSYLNESIKREHELDKDRHDNDDEALKGLGIEV